ncbi:MFS general substrate transporter [Coprinellus micaceus]|uniref:MFS general substrate transporter n=1 Tax=Coprinellus micaceus TaxID=71717 RepID=A0A4Y7SC33_COPMI|nr:MFS general substrate transporter [Coprinellus micaceus]
MAAQDDRRSQSAVESNSKIEAEAEALDHGLNENTSEDEYPEGGMYAWATVLGAVLVQFCGLGYTTTFGVFQDYYTRIYLTNASPSAISWIGSVNSFLCIAASLCTGILYDKGYFYHLLYGGSLLISFSLFMLSFTQPNRLYQVFLAQGIGFGLGSGLNFLPTVAIVSQHFNRRESLAMIIVVSGASLGAIVHPILLNKLFAMPELGFVRTVRASAAMVSGLLIVACLLIRQREKPGDRQRAGGGTSKNTNVWDIVTGSAKDLPFMCFCISLAVFSIGFYYPIFYLQLDAIKHGVDEGFSFYVLTITNVGCLVGGLLPAVLVKAFGEEAIVVGSAIATAASVFAILGLKDLVTSGNSLISTVVIAVVYGLFIGMFFALQGPIVSVLTPDASTLGARLGIAFTSCAVGALVGPPIHGALLTDAFDWQKPAVFSGVGHIQCARLLEPSSDHLPRFSPF